MLCCISNIYDTDIHIEYFHELHISNYILESFNADSGHYYIVNYWFACSAILNTAAQRVNWVICINWYVGFLCRHMEFVTDSKYSWFSTCLWPNKARAWINDHAHSHLTNICLLVFCICVSPKAKAHRFCPELLLWDNNCKSWSGKSNFRFFFLVPEQWFCFRSASMPLSIGHAVSYAHIFITSSMPKPFRCAEQLVSACTAHCRQCDWQALKFPQYPNAIVMFGTRAMQITFTCLRGEINICLSKMEQSESVR